MLQTELARDLDIGKVTVGGLIDRLEAAGYVRREPDRGDRRAKRIQVTEAGRVVLGQMIAVGRGLNETILAGLPSPDIAVAERALEIMKDNIRRAVHDRDEVDLPVGIALADETAPTDPASRGQPTRHPRG